MHSPTVAAGALSVLPLLLTMARAQVVSLPETVCENYNETAPEFMAAYDSWTQHQPECYQYAFQFLGFSLGPPTPETRSVVRGEAVNMTPDQAAMQFKTIQDFYEFLNQECVASCPESGAHSCSLTYTTVSTTSNDELATAEETTFQIPESIYVDMYEMLKDEERVYRISNFTVIDCDEASVAIVEGPPPPNIMDNNSSEFPPAPNCEGFIETQQEFQSAEALLETSLAEHDSCYDFSYKKIIFSPVPPTDVQVQVRQGAAVTFNDNQEFNTILDVMSLIQTECLDACANGGQGPAKCTVNYNSAGAPSFVTVDYDARIADEELYYSIDGFQFVDCVSGEPIEKEPPASETNNCVDYVDVQNKLQAAQQVWSSPPCYSYSVERVGEILPENAGPFSVQVENGAAVLIGDFPTDTSTALDKTVEEWFALVQEKCVQGCPDAGMAYQCTVEFDTTSGSPKRLEMDYDATTVDEEDIFVISDFTPYSCIVVENPGDETPPDVTDDPIANEPKCLDYETVEDEFETARTKLRETLSDGKCYTFTYLYQGFTFPPPEPIKVQVNGATTDTRSSSSINSMDDIMNMIQTNCIDKCPAEPGTVGAPKTCSVVYDDETGHPTSLFIDFSEFLADEEFGYKISDFSLVECPATIASAKCVNSEKVQADLTAAQDKWSQIDPACYDFTIEKFDPSATGAVSQQADGVPQSSVIKVRNHEVVDGGEMDETISTLLSTVEDICLTGCPEGTAKSVYKCELEFRDDGSPAQIIIDYNDLVDGDEEVYSISSLTLFDCGDTPDSTAAESESSANSLQLLAAMVISLVFAAFF